MKIFEENTLREHGGNIQEAAQRWGIPAEQWLDLSTAISPFSYPLPTSIPTEVWQRLPYNDSHLIRAAQAYYACDHVQAVAGSQQAIEILPRLFRNKRVAIPLLGYSEHAHHWQKSENTVEFYKSVSELQDWVEHRKINIALVINPNNPTAELLSRQYLLDLAKKLQLNDGLLVVDEAFIDSQTEYSLSPVLPENVVVLRSVGKFFGLAGIRMGFVLAHPPLLKTLNEQLGLWSCSGPAIWAAEQALSDKKWQVDQIRRLENCSLLLEQQLQQFFPSYSIKRQSLFVTVALPEHLMEDAFVNCAKNGILLRRFQLDDGMGLLRIGIPGNYEITEALLKALSCCNFCRD